MRDVIYKISPRAAWSDAVAAGIFHGAPIDRQDGYIHFSTAAQLAETAAKHFSGQDDLMLVAVAAERLGDALAWEPARGGALFPHLYGPLPMEAVISTAALPRGSDGVHIFPEGLVS